MTNQKMYCRKFVSPFCHTDHVLKRGFNSLVYDDESISHICQNHFYSTSLPGIVTAYYVILLKTYIKSLPKELEESARMDEAGILPCLQELFFLCPKPIVATIAVYSLVGQWNQWTDNYFPLYPDAKLQSVADGSL